MIRPICKVVSSVYDFDGVNVYYLQLFLSNIQPYLEFIVNFSKLIIA